MPAWYVIAIKAQDKDATYLQRKILSAKQFGAAGKTTSRQAAKAVSDTVNGLVSGAQPGQLYLGVVSDDGPRSSGTITCTTANAAGDTLTFTYGGLTAVLTEGVDFARGATDAELATNLSAALGRNHITGGLYTATPAGNVVTLTSKLPPSPVEAITITTNDGSAFAIVQPTGGSNAGATVFFQNFQTGRTA